MVFLLSIARSAICILRVVLSRRSYDVILYYPRHFNRSDRGTNPYFDRLIESLEEHHVRYLLIEGGRPNRGARTDVRAVSFDAVLAVIEGCRLLRRLLAREQGEVPIECFFGSMRAGRLFNCVTLGAFRAPVVITISMSQAAFWRGVHPKARLFDLQHGQISPRHYVYFQAPGQVRRLIRELRVEVLVYGNGFRRCFGCQSDEGTYAASVWVIGNPLLAGDSPRSLSDDRPEDCRAIMFSVQFSNEIASSGKMAAMRDDLLAVMDTFQRLCERYDFRLVFKLRTGTPPPLEIADFEQRYSFLRFSDESLKTACRDVFYHVTFYSTVAFDVAAWGIPTFFICTPRFPEGLAYSEDLGYPVHEEDMETALATVVRAPQRYAEWRKAVRVWYDAYYEPYDKEKFLRAIGMEVGG